MSDPMGRDDHHLSSIDERINVRGYFERILAERDRNDAERNKRLDERFEAQEKAVQFALTEREKAVNAALIAAKEAVAAALTAAKEAVMKAEESARETMASHNDLIRQSRDRDATYATQTDIKHIGEAISKVQGIQSKIIGALMLASVGLPTASAILVYLITRK